MYNANAANVFPETYDLPNQFTGFIDVCKQRDVDKDTGFTNFIKALINQKAPGILTLKNWLETFLANKDII